MGCVVMYFTASAGLCDGFNVISSGMKTVKMAIENDATARENFKQGFTLFENSH